MNSIERKAGGECIGGLSGDTDSEVRVDLHSTRGTKVKERTVAWNGESHLAR